MSLSENFLKDDPKRTKPKRPRLRILGMDPECGLESEDSQSQTDSQSGWSFGSSQEGPKDVESQSFKNKSQHVKNLIPILFPPKLTLEQCVILFEQGDLWSLCNTLDPLHLIENHSKILESPIKAPKIP